MIPLGNLSESFGSAPSRKRATETHKIQKRQGDSFPRTKRTIAAFSVIMKFSPPILSLFLLAAFKTEEASAVLEVALEAALGEPFTVSKALH